MNKRFKVGLALISSALAVSLTGCDLFNKDKGNDVDNGGDNNNTQQTDVEVESVTCTDSAKNLFVGDTYKLTVTVAPENATNKTVTFSSSNEAVASVDSEGTITAKSVGTALISASTSNGKSAYVAVSVQEKEPEIVLPTGIEVDFETAELVVGDTKQVVATVLPENATNKNVEYLTDAKTVATVDQRGLIKAVGAGTATITVRSLATASVFKTIEVTVVSNIVDVTDIVVSPASYEILVGGTADIAYEVLPANATDKTVTFSVPEADKDIVAVSQTGTITGKKAGSALVYVTSNQNGKSKAVQVTVKEEHTAVEDITISATAVTIAPESTYQISATVLPSDATNKTLTYSSNDQTVLLVSSSGSVTALKVGVATITIQSVDNPAVVKTLTVTVEEEIVPVSSVTISGDKAKTINIKDKDVISLSAVVAPDNASDKSLRWSSNNEAVATVDQNGNVTPKGVVGQATITVESITDTTKTDSFVLTVGEVLVESINFEINTVSVSEHIDFIYPDIAAGNTKTLTAVVAPENANDKSIVWSSSQSSVATVVNGVVTPKGLGSTTIRATNLHSGVYKEIIVNVKSVDVESIKIYKDSEEVTSFELSSTDITAETKVQLSAVVLPENATDKTVSWSSSNQNIIKVSETGLVQAYGCGTATVRASSNDDASVYKEVVITVGEVMVTDIELRANGQELGESIEFSTKDIGDSSKKKTIEAVVYPGTAYNKDLSWNVVNSSVASVAANDNEAVITPLAQGSTTLIVTNTKSGVSASVVINVVAPARYSVTLPVAQSESFTRFKVNKAEKDNELEEYNDKNQTYKVGHMNAINLRPHFVVNDLETGEQVSESFWSYDYNITVKKFDGSAYTAAPASDYSILDAKTCDIKFAPSAIGGKFSVDIQIGNVAAVAEDEEDLEKSIANYNFEVVNGWNIYNEDELAYFDTTTTASYQVGAGISYLLHGETAGEVIHGIDMGRTLVDYPAFKVQKNLDPSLIINNLILHNDLVIKKENVAKELFYSAEEASKVEAKDQAATLGSLKDYVPLYMHTADYDVNIEGNYFKIDYANIPLINRPFGEIQTEDNKLDSHSAFFKTTKGTIAIKNLTTTGNSRNAKDDAETIYAGGLFFLKSADYATSTTLKNVISSSQYITMMSEKGTGDREKIIQNINVEDVKMFNHYNTFLYNWSGIINAKNCTFNGCGGPAIIQDHTGISSSDEKAYSDQGLPTDLAYRDFDESHPYHVKGYPSTSIFTNCAFENNLIGTEAWFNSFGEAASALPAQIKSMSDLVYMKSGKSFVRAKQGDNFVPTVVQATPADVKTTINVLLLNKSGNTQGVTLSLVDGSAVFKNSTEDGGEIFNYFNPGEGTAFMTEQGQLYNGFRNAQRSGAPVIQTNSGAFAITDPNPAAPGTMDLYGNLAQSGNYVAIYYNGMMIVLKLYTVGA